jgi:hypothetical protein
VNRTPVWACLGVLVTVLALSAAPGADETKKPKGVFSALKVGQSVSLKDEGSAFTLTVFEPDLPQSHKVIEVGDNFIVVRDIAGISDTTIPVFSLKSIVKVRTNKP